MISITLLGMFLINSTPLKWNPYQTCAAQIPSNSPACTILTTNFAHRIFLRAQLLTKPCAHYYPVHRILLHAQLTCQICAHHSPACTTIFLSAEFSCVHNAPSKICAHNLFAKFSYVHRMCLHIVTTCLSSKFWHD